MSTFVRALLLSLLLSLSFADNAIAASKTITSAGGTALGVIMQETVDTYASVGVQFTSVGSGNSVSFEESADGVTWTTSLSIFNNATSGSFPGTGFAPAASSTYVGSIRFPYWRIRVTAYSSGTVTAVATFKDQPLAQPLSSVSGLSGSGSANVGNPVKTGCAYNSTPPTVTTGQTVDCQADTRGSTRAVLYTENTNTAIGASQATNTVGTGLLADITNGLCDVSGVTVITENNFGPIRMSCTEHAQYVLQSTTSEQVFGLSLHTLTAANTTNATNVKGTSGNIYRITIENVSATTPAWLSLYNNAGTPTCGTGIIQQFLVPSTATGAIRDIPMDIPKPFSSGIAYCLTTGVAGTGAVAASSYVVNIDYR